VFVRGDNAAVPVTIPLVVVLTAAAGASNATIAAHLGLDVDTVRR
jgi:hypothetical protein